MIILASSPCRLVSSLFFIGATFVEKKLGIGVGIKAMSFFFLATIYAALKLICNNT